VENPVSGIHKLSALQLDRIRLLSVTPYLNSKLTEQEDMLNFLLTVAEHTIILTFNVSPPELMSRGKTVVGKPP
jgi:hypothetical protein